MPEWMAGVRKEFKIDNKELSSRKSFIDQTREEVKVMKDKMNISRGRDRDRTARQVGTAWLTGTVEGMKYFRQYYDRIVMPLLENSPARVPTSHGTTKYSKLENELDSPNRQFLDDTLQQQNHMVRAQDEQLDMISDSVGTLKTVSRQIGSELDEQAVSKAVDRNRGIVGNHGSGYHIIHRNLRTAVTWCSSKMVPSDSVTADSGPFEGGRDKTGWKGLANYRCEPSRKEGSASYRGKPGRKAGLASYCGEPGRKGGLAKYHGEPGRFDELLR
uniref:t-SNARE coiled-coil homology domain-containing protein n=1 Tax=Timema shepardi TaxID=629360 RepID=A0A7R9FWM6_TIMSH|nr:unnamed protein product [Timema shepardi]